MSDRGFKFMKTKFLSILFPIVLFVSLLEINGAHAAASGEITVFERVYNTELGRRELPQVAVPSLKDQIKLYQALYLPYAVRDGEEPQFAIQGFENMIDIGFSYAWKHVQIKSNFKKPILEIFYRQAIEDAAQNRMTLATFKQHILRLGIVLSVNAQDPFKNKNVKFFNEKASELYFQNSDQMNTSWMFEAILFTDFPYLDYGIFIDALADEKLPLLLSAFSTKIGNPAGFLRHDYGHNSRTAANANIPAIRYIIDKIKSVKSQFDAKDKVMLFYMFHELMLRFDLNNVNSPQDAFQNWCKGTKKSVVNAFFSQIADDARMRGLLLPAGIDGNNYHRGVYEIISKDIFQYTLVSKSQPFKNYLKALITITNPGHYRLTVIEIGPKLLQNQDFMASCKVGQDFEGAHPTNVYGGQTENKMFKERIEDLKYIYGEENVAKLINCDDYSALLLFLQTFDTFYEEYQHLFE